MNNEDQPDANTKRILGRMEVLFAKQQMRDIDWRFKLVLSIGVSIILLVFVYAVYSYVNTSFTTDRFNQVDIYLQRVRQDINKVETTTTQIADLLKLQTKKPEPSQQEIDKRLSEEIDLEYVQNQARSATLKILGKKGGSVTVLSPVRPDGRWNLITSCSGLVAGEKIQVRDLRGSVYDTTVMAISVEVEADLAWLVTDHPVIHLTSMKLASKNCEVGGEYCWHCGLGSDKPSNIEEGKVIRGFNLKPNTQAKFSLSIYYGDNGAGIFNRKGELIGVVSNTAKVGHLAEVGGGCVEQIHDLMRSVRENPMELPK